MYSHHAMPNIECRSTCKHPECQRHSHTGLVNLRKDCPCLGEIDASSLFIENILDLANALADIMKICGIHECKAKNTIDITAYAFLHYDAVCYCIDQRPKKRLRKEDIFYELGSRCVMSRIEAHTAYSIIKYAFKAFYYMPRYRDKNAESNCPMSYTNECAYVHAAKRTAESYARFEGMSFEQMQVIESKIKKAYKKFFDRMMERLSKPAGEECNCCFCAKKRGHLVYGVSPPTTDIKPKKRVCAVCCKKSKKKQAKGSDLCPLCHRSRKCCTCQKYKFDLDWVKSIWNREDFTEYFNKRIDAAERSTDDDQCEDECEEEDDFEIIANEEGNEPAVDAEPITNNENQNVDEGTD